MTKRKQHPAPTQQGRPDTDKDDFKTVAKRLDCDTDKGRFKAKLGKLAKAATKKG